eukprot:2922535-Alexandrium_andersonii.AAC.1
MSLPIQIGLRWQPRAFLGVHVHSCYAEPVPATQPLGVHRQGEGGSAGERSPERHEVLVHAHVVHPSP